MSRSGPVCSSGSVARRKSRPQDDVVREHEALLDRYAIPHVIPVLLERQRVAVAVAVFAVELSKMISCIDTFVRTARTPRLRRSRSKPGRSRSPSGRSRRSARPVSIRRQARAFARRPSGTRSSPSSMQASTGRCLPGTHRIGPTLASRIMRVDARRWFVWLPWAPALVRLTF